MSNVLMPQMGESVAEGTIVRWIKHVGEAIDKDEPLFEISTDKVDAEIPAPDSGVLVEIRVKEGETVPVHSVVAVIGSAEDVARAAAQTASGASPSPAREARGAKRGAEGHAQADPGAGMDASVGRGLAAAPGDVRTDGDQAGDETPRTVRPSDAQSREGGATGRILSSPIVRKIARAHGIDLAQLTGTGISGRVTKRDIERFIDQSHAAGKGEKAHVFGPGEDVHVEKMTVMRRKIADRMVASLRTSAHIYSAYEVDCSRIEHLRHEHKARYQEAGTNLTYTAFIAKAVADTIREFPYVNASLDGDTIVYKRDINIGIAVALEQGLIVPVIRKADERSLIDLCRAIQDLAQRARAKHLKHEDIEGGTFTVTNPGVFGGLWGLPIISQPQVAILAVGSIDRRAVVVDDMIAIRPMCYLTLGYDHRLIDGADGGRFLQALKTRLQEFDAAWM